MSYGVWIRLTAYRHLLGYTNEPVDLQLATPEIQSPIATKAVVPTSTTVLSVQLAQIVSTVGPDGT
jgi:hypothetical protein